MASYAVNTDAVAFIRGLIDKKQYVLDSDWGQVQPSAAQQNAYLESHKDVELAAHDLLQHLDAVSGPRGR